MPSEVTNEATRNEWRKLGFFYDRNDDSKAWRIVGSRAGLHKFAALISAYAADPRNESLSEHDHIGPYAYLEIGTWSHPEITDHWIAGPLPTLAILAASVEAAVKDLQIGDRVSLRASFAPNSPYDLVLELRSDTFDPAREDAACW